MHDDDGRKSRAHDTSPEPTRSTPVPDASRADVRAPANESEVLPEEHPVAAAAASATPPPADAAALERPPIESEIARVRDQLLRVAADFDNYRKRTRKAEDDARNAGREEAVLALAIVFDNLDRAVEHAATSGGGALIDGVALVLRQLDDQLARLGIERFSSIGSAFDPSLHEAVHQIETADAPAGSVVREMSRGYRSKTRLMRPAIVIVAKSPRPSGNGTPEPDDDAISAAGEGTDAAAEPPAGAKEEPEG